MRKFLKNILPGSNLSEKIYLRYKIAHIFYLKKLKKISKFITYRTYRKYNCIISPTAQIGKNLEVPHPIGIVIGEGAIIGDNCVIYQNVTLGRKNRDCAEYPELGNNVIVYCNSTIVGNIKIGDNSIIGCNTVVLKSVNDNSKCTGVVK